MRVHREDCELIRFFDWVRWQEKIHPEFRAIFHVENEAQNKSRKAGFISKQKGKRAGVHDVLCLIPRGEYHGLTIEFKTPGNKMTDEQNAFAEVMHSLGFAVRLAYSADQALKILKDYLCLTSTQKIRDSAA